MILRPQRNKASFMKKYPKVRVFCYTVLGCSHCKRTVCNVLSQQGSDGKMKKGPGDAVNWTHEDNDTVRHIQYANTCFTAETGQ